MGSDHRGRPLNNNRSNNRSNLGITWGDRYQDPAHPYEQVQGTAKGPGGEYRAHVEDMGGKYRVGVYQGSTTVSEGSTHATEKRARRAAARAVKKHASGNP